MTASGVNGGRASWKGSETRPIVNGSPQPVPPAPVGARSVLPKGTAPARGMDLLPEGVRDLVAHRHAGIVGLAQARPDAVAAMLSSTWVTEVFVSTCEPRLAVQVYRSIRDQLETHKRKELLRRIVKRISKAATNLSEAKRDKKPFESRGYRPGDADWDLDYTLERLNERPGQILTYDNIRTADLTPPGLAVCIMADKSQSVGAVLHDIAIACAVACHRLKDESVSVLMFDKAVAFARRFDDEDAPERTIERVIDMDSGGATDLFKPLVAAKDEFASVPASRTRKAILITDLVATRGKDPRPVAQDLPALTVVCVPGFSDKIPSLAHTICSLHHCRLIWSSGQGAVVEAVLDAISSP